jgi:DNA-binding MarR family transcriptional regulator
LQELGINSYQYFVLRELIVLGKKGEGNVTTRLIYSALKMDRTTFARGFEYLKKVGWVTSTIDPIDRRKRVVKATEAGKRKFQESDAVMRSLHEGICKEYGEKKYSRLQNDIYSFLDVAQSVEKRGKYRW